MQENFDLSTLLKSPSWRAVLQDEFKKDYFKRLNSNLAHEIAAHRVFPPPHEIFAAFELTPFERVRVVVLGQDPYHAAGRAVGLAFGVARGVKPPPSLRNIYAEITRDTGEAMDGASGDLRGWARQGVLLLNAALSVREGAAGSHARLGWQGLAGAALRAVWRRGGAAFLLWGRAAQAAFAQAVGEDAANECAQESQKWLDLADLAGFCPARDLQNSPNFQAQNSQNSPDFVPQNSQNWQNLQPQILRNSQNWRAQILQNSSNFQARNVRNWQEFQPQNPQNSPNTLNLQAQNLQNSQKCQTPQILQNSQKFQPQRSPNPRPAQNPQNPQFLQPANPANPAQNLQSSQNPQPLQNPRPAPSARPAQSPQPQPPRNLVLRAAHPSPLARGGFAGCGHFSKTNAFLVSLGTNKITWSNVFSGD